MFGEVRECQTLTSNYLWVCVCVYVWHTSLAYSSLGLGIGENFRDMIRVDMTHGSLYHNTLQYDTYCDILQYSI